MWEGLWIAIGALIATANLDLFPGSIARGEVVLEESEVMLVKVIGSQHFVGVLHYKPKMARMRTLLALNSGPVSPSNSFNQLSFRSQLHSLPPC